MPPLGPFNRNFLTLAISQALLMPAQAATIQVTSNADDNGAVCTLRQAIVSINSQALQTGSGCINTGDGFGTNDSITFADGLAGSNAHL